MNESNDPVVESEENEKHKEKAQETQEEHNLPEEITLSQPENP